MTDRLEVPFGSRRICYRCGNSYPDTVRFCPKDSVDLEYIPPPLDELARDFRHPGKWRGIFMVLVFAVIAAAFCLLDRTGSVPAEINASRGDLTVRTSPAGAQVYLDGSQVGVTPVLLADIPTGLHEVHAVFPGYLDRFAQVEILPSSTRKLVWDLAPLPRLNKRDRTRYLAELSSGNIHTPALPALKEPTENI